jgi:hypothetical protein
MLLERETTLRRLVRDYIEVHLIILKSTKEYGPKIDQNQERELAVAVDLATDCDWQERKRRFDG